jgi:hypothetical protein
MLRKSARSIWISTINKMVEHQPRKRTIHVLLNRTVLLATNRGHAGTLAEGTLATDYLYLHFGYTG